MTNVICPGCGANYPEANVAKVAKFRCAGCGEILAGGLLVAGAAPPPAARAPAAKTPAARAPAAAAPAPAAPRSARRRAPAERPAKGGVPPAVLVVGAVVVVGIIVAVVVKSGGSGDAAPDASSPGAAAQAPAEAAKPDPMKDPAAWKALPAAERESRAAKYVESADVTTSDAAVRPRDFLLARGETAAVAALSERVLATDGDCAWAHVALGHVNVGDEVDSCLKSSPDADDANDEGFRALKAERAKHAIGTWWADAESAKKVRERIAAVRKADELLRTPYGQAVAHWINLQRATPIMRETPAINAVVGPYVIFVSLSVPKETKDAAASPKDGALAHVSRKDVTLADVPKEELERGMAVLERDRKLFAEFYDGWMEAIGKPLGMTKYGPENSDLRTIMKVNVFSKAEDFNAYNQKTGTGIPLFTRAYYSPMEPRFVTTYDASGVKKGPDDEAEDIDYVDHVQCHEATHQLVHFYTWDLTRKDIGRDPDWLHVAWRPLWSGEGFAEFCSAFTVKDGKRVWMQPLEQRIREMWIFQEMVKEKGWKPWRLYEFLTLPNGVALNQFAESRAKTNADEVIATGVMANLFYGEAWSFVYFLWYYEENGKPKYRDRYIDYLKAEFHVKFVADPKTGGVQPSPAYSGTFAAIMGLSNNPTDAKWDALEKEWKDYTAKIIAAHRKPEWDAERTKMRKNFRFDQPDKKDDKPK